MKNQKQTKIPEIKVDELLSTIDNIRWENGYEFSYNGTSFLLFLLTAAEHMQNESREEAEYFKSTEKEGWDIYFLETLTDEKRRKELFHEIAECNLRDQYFSNSEAHQIALTAEQHIFGRRKPNS
jgi:hypothetical protein